MFKQADKELLIAYNPASKATPPKAKRPKVNYFDVDQLDDIQREAEKQPIKWRTIIHLLLVGGMRRAEVCGLKWDAIDWENSRLYIHINLLYSPKIGIYEDTTKTEYSERYVKMPAESMELLREYQHWYNDTKAVYPAPTATAARTFCHTLPLTAHGHCPAKKRARLTSTQTGSGET